MFLLIDFDIAMVTLTHVKILWNELGLSSFIKIKQGGSQEEDENVKKKLRRRSLRQKWKHLIFWK